MKHQPSCPRCGLAVRPPGLWSSAWQCPAHGPVPPLQPVRPPGSASLDGLLRAAQVPVFVPWPLPTGWVVTGFADAGDERSGALAAAVALSGPAPLGGVGEMALVAEDPGIGLGARLAGLNAADPGDGFGSGRPHLHLRQGRREVPMWPVEGADGRAAYAGESHAGWFWLVLSPSGCDVATCELEGVRDLRDRGDGVTLEPPYGAPSPFLQSVLSPQG
ncbi:DUF6758 family protein [Nocardiopsis coralliicola]